MAGNFKTHCFSIFASVQYLMAHISFAGVYVVVECTVLPTDRIPGLGHRGPENLKKGQTQKKS